MGHTIGKTFITAKAKPLVNLPRSLLETLSQSVYEVADRFGLSSNELKQITQISLHEWPPESSIDECSESETLLPLFSTGDTLIGSFNFLATIYIVSSMQLDEKVHFIFKCVKLNVNKKTLTFRALVSGTSKISTTSASIG